MSAFRAALALGALSTALLACQSGNAPERRAEAAKAPVRPADGERPKFVRGPTGGAAVAPFVAEELKRGQREHRGVLVYVGATWCEPCQGFHRAVEKGELDGLLAGVRLVEFDLDQDRDALQRAGYVSRLIPLFAMPKPDGTASEQRIEGSIKGPAAVEQNLVPRLRAFLKGQVDG